MALPNWEPALWAKLVALPLDRLSGEPAPEFGFVKRLMREEGWDYATAIRVAAEYRRFLLLAALGPVSPSPKVDAAWHLHLTYTRAYNIGLCEHTLGHRLDHTPSGGSSETAHYEAVYEDTLNRYLAVFGEEPPADIWPPVKPHIRAAKPELKPKPWSSARIAGSLAFVLTLGFLARPGFALFLTVVFLVVAASVAHAMSDEGKKRKADGSSCGGGGCGSGGDGGSCGSSCGSGCGGGCGGCG